jgi:hypothetical protein
MNDMMRACGEWMMSLGWAGMLLVLFLVVALVVLVVALVGRVWRGQR